MSNQRIVGAVNKRKALDKIPDEIEYYKHQIDAVREMVRRSGTLLADEMGLGKSLTASTVAACAFQTGEINRVLIVTPASLKGNWFDELQEFTNFKMTIVPSGVSKAKRSEIISSFDVKKSNGLIVNYEQVIAHVDELNAIGFDFIIYDEAHYMKNRKSARTKACFRLRGPRHILLTGSPLLNQVDDLWALLHRIDPVEFPNYWRFINRYAVYGGYQDKQIVGVKNESELRDRIKPYMIRREKKDCLDLPDKQYIQVKLDLHPQQKKLYDKALEEMEIPVPGADPMAINNALTKFLRLKQICGTTATIEGHPDHSTKLDRAVEMAEEIIGNGHPVVMFTQFRGVLAALAERLRVLKPLPIPCWQLHGGVPADDRRPTVKRWADAALEGHPGVLACMFQVGGVGLTMTAAQHVFLLDKLFVPALNEQAVDRLHRIGQTQVVQVYEFMMRGTVETRIERIIKTKKTVFGQVVQSNDSEWKRKLIAAAMEDEELDT